MSIIRPRSIVIATLLALGATGVVAGQAPRFLPDDPIVIDADDLPMPKPNPIELSLIYDLFSNSYGLKLEDEIPAAMNVNTLGGVPDSSWFTNRIGVRDMSIRELVRGSIVGDGPDGELTVIDGKFSGITPGFTVHDAVGDVYFLKFDRAEHPNLSTAADVIGSRFFHAFGYNVPENHIAYLHPDALQISPDAQVRLTVERKRVPMQRAHLEEILSGVARLPDGRVRVVASKAVPGEPVGPFRFFDTRSDDANDIFPHQHRRELRGYRVFAAWLNHDDSRALNTLDTYLGDDGEGHLKHYLIDFSSSLGSGSDARRRIAPQNPRAGNEYIIEIKPALMTALTLGIWERPWMKVDYRYPLYPEAGRIEAEFFEPQKWRPEYPNPAFERMLPDDAFWAARIVSRFSDAAIRAMVRTGEYDDAETAEFLSGVIIERRDKVVAYYFAQLNPLDDFRVDGAGRLRFENAGERAGLATVEAYEYEWFRFDNDTGETATIMRGETGEAVVGLPSAAIVDGAEYLMLRIRTRAPQLPNWLRAVDVYVRAGATPSVVGVDREINSPAP